MTRHHPAKEVELYRENDEYVVLFDLPGYDPADVDVRWRDRRLHVSAEHHGEGDRKGVYHRSVGVPKSIDEDGIDAAYEDGVLEVTLPIRERQDTGRKIDVRGE